MDKKIGKRAEASIRDIEKEHYKAIYLLVSGITFFFAASVIVYFFTPASTSYVPSCRFASGTSCNSLIVNSNSTYGRMKIIVTNTHPYTILAPKVQVNISDSIFTSEDCEPHLVAEGGSILCNVDIPQDRIQNGTVTGIIYLSDNPCQDGNILDCQNVTTETDKGVFSAIMSPTPASGNVVMKLNATNATQDIKYGGDKVTAIMQFLNSPIKMAFVNFTVNTTSATITPNQIMSDGNGTAVAYLSSLSTGPVKVTASFGNVSQNITVDFVSSPSGYTGSGAAATNSAVTTTIPAGNGTIAGYSLPRYTNGNQMGYAIINFSQTESAIITFNTTLTVVENFITPTTAGISVNDQQFNLYPGIPVEFMNTTDYAYFLNLTDIYYLPILHTVTLMVYRQSRVPVQMTNTTTTTITAASTTAFTIGGSGGGGGGGGAATTTATTTVPTTATTTPTTVASTSVTTSKTSTSASTTIGTANTGLGAPTVTPSAPSQGTGFTISCPTNSQTYDCIDAYSNSLSGKCAFTSWSGNNAQFTCDSLAAGSYVATCKASTGTSSGCQDATTNMNYTVAAGTSLTTTSVPSTSTSSSTIASTSTSTTRSTTSTATSTAASTSTGTSSTSVPTTSTSSSTSSTSINTTSTKTTTSTSTSTSSTKTTTSTVASTSSTKTTTKTTTAASTTVGSGQLSWSGRTWDIRQSSSITGPGDNYFYYNSNSDYVDANGYLHMSILNVNGKRYASEINVTQSLGYGTYSFVIQGDVSKLDKNAVLGVFTWDDSSNSASGNTYNREIDMEMSRWACASCTNDEVGVQPEPPEAVRDFWMNYTGDITESMTWKAGEVDFVIKETAAPYTVLYQWNYVGSLVPTPGAEKMRINLWADEAPTASNVTVVIKSFTYTSN